MNDRDILKIQNLNETKIFKVPIHGWEIKDNKLRFDISYQDQNGINYTGLSEFEVKVNDVSFLRKTSAFFQRLFFSLSKPEVTSF